MPVRALAPYIAGSCMMLIGTAIAVFVLIPLMRDYHRLKGAERVEVAELVQLELAYQGRFKVEYRYVVGGQTYTSERISTMPAFIQKRAVLERARASARKGCLVDPQDPSESVLLNEFDAFSFWVLLLGFILFPLGLGGYAIYCGRYETRRWRE